MKQKLIESVEATRQHFKNKRCTVFSYMRHLEKEFKLRDLNVAAEELHNLMLEKIREGGVWEWLHNSQSNH